MKPLLKILTGVKVLRMHGSDEREISLLQFDSRKVEQGTLFAAIRGTQTDGHQYINLAIASGAHAILCETFPKKLQNNITYIEVENAAHALGIIASNFFDHPSQALQLIGVTGTNGKTTTVSLLYHLFEELGIKTGMISTISNKVHQETIEATHTTPDTIQLHQLLRQMVDSGCRFCFMEVSSHAIDQQRIAGLTFAGGIFTNLTHDHLDYHKSFASYINVKKTFFDQLNPEAFALVNKDDKHVKVMLQNCPASTYTYSLNSMADFRCKILENTVQGLHMTIEGQEVWFRLIGRFNAYNLLATYATAVLLGLERAEILTGLSQMHPVDGRFTYVISPEKVIAVIDYAHTPDALQNVLETINDIRQGVGQLITIAGAGGNRDPLKRPVMAKIACQLSSRVILTSDNPRDEEPEVILEEMKKGVPAEFMKNLLVISNRREAIKTACSLAQSGDYILIAGKGHETYQEIKGVKHPFDDQAVVREVFGINTVINKE
ncbi:MAG: UDP-N-acetylmuramoyl-L-alanyl-D-glutamate--2,6-diaminopimelate ligase [Bacteroidales bacterium]|nr:UDP-N-acetylmuramoyl-L-alanyl-D-glutamate--2,6-diaminopimelate ligase [Bacteroidales bacterium]